MVELEYITFPTALLLSRVPDFTEVSEKFVGEDGRRFEMQEVLFVDINTGELFLEKEDISCLICPSFPQDLICKYLRDNCKIFMSLDNYGGSLGFKCEVFSRENSKNCSIRKTIASRYNFSTFEEAREWGIKVSLESIL